MCYEAVFFTQLQMIQRTTDNIVTERFPWWLFNFLFRIHISTFDNWQLRWRTSYLLNQQTGRRMITENLKAINVWALALLKQHWILYDWLTRCVVADSQCNWLTILELWSQLHCSSYQLREGWWVGFETNFYFLARPWAETEAGGEADEDQLAPRAPMTPPQTHDDTLDTSVNENGSSWWSCRCLIWQFNLN